MSDRAKPSEPPAGLTAEHAHFDPNCGECTSVPVGAYVASALMAANYGGDSGEDVDHFLNELEARGYAVVPLSVALAAEKAADRALRSTDIGQEAATPNPTHLSTDDIVRANRPSVGQEAPTLREAVTRIVDEEWPEYVDHLVAGTTPSLLLTYIRRDLRAALAASSTPEPPSLDAERLAEAHWLLVNEVNRTDEAYLSVLDWIEPLVTHEASERADARLSPEPPSR